MSSSADKPVKVARLVRHYRNRKQKRRRKRLILMPLRIVFFGALFIVCVYFGIQLYGALNTPMRTTPALSTYVTDEFSSVGYFFRSEKVIRADYSGILEYSLADGERTARFAPYASVYHDKAAVETNNRIAATNEKIRSLEAALSVSSDTSSAADLSDKIYEQLLNVTEIADSGVYTRMDNPQKSLKNLIVTRDFSYKDTVDISSLITSLKKNRDSLKSRISERETVLYTPYAGYFMSGTDGFEELYSTSDLKSLQVEDVRALSEVEKKPERGVVGKIITGYDWYFVMVLRRSEAEQLKQGYYVTLRFDATGDVDIRAKVHSIGNYADEETVVVLYGEKFTEELMSFRKQSASIILNSYSGLKVPKEAVRVNDKRQMGVYVITGTYAEFKKINVLYETRDYYVVSTDPKDKSSLLIYDNIIVSAKDLSSGKVVK